MGATEGALSFAILDQESRTPVKEPTAYMKNFLAYMKSFFGNSTYGELIAAIDDFYRDPANRQIPVIKAMQYFQDKVSGSSNEKLAGELAAFRKAYAGKQ